jgi:hypothetical protein
MKKFKRTFAAIAAAEIPAMVMNHRKGIAQSSVIALHTCTNKDCKTVLSMNKLAEALCPVCASVSKPSGKSAFLSKKDVAGLPIICTCGTKGCGTVIRASASLAEKMIGAKFVCPVCAAENIGVEAAEEDSDDDGGDGDDTDETGDESSLTDDDDGATDDDDDDITDDATGDDADSDDATTDDADGDATDDMSEEGDPGSADDDGGDGDDTDDTDETGDDGTGDEHADPSDVSGIPDMTDNDTSDADEGTEEGDETGDETADPDDMPAPGDMPPDATDDDDSTDVKASLIDVKGGKKLTVFVPNKGKNKTRTFAMIVGKKVKISAMPKAERTSKTKVVSEILTSTIAKADPTAEHALVQVGAGAESKWFWFVNQQPIAVASYKNANENIKRVFATAKFSQAFTLAADEGLTDENVKDFGFEPIKTKVAVDEATEAHIASQISAMSAQYGTRLQEVAEHFEQCIGIAADGINKGVFKEKENKLRTTLIAALTKQGVKRAEGLVNTVFAEQSKPFMKEIVAKAIELSKKKIDNLNEVAAMVKDADFRIPVAANLEEPKNSGFHMSLSEEQVNLDKGGASIEITAAPATERKAHVDNLVRNIRR